MKRPTFETGEIYHVYNRGVDKRDVFMDNKDYFRFIHDLYEFNDEAPALNSGYYSGSDFKPSDEVRRLKHKRSKLVDIFCFCAMPNHYHLLMRQKVDGGITSFIRKLGTGYTNYFNTKNDRVGVLFQGKTKSIHVSNEAHLRYLPHYIHLNPVDIIKSRTRNGVSPEGIINFLKSYRWSSYPDYVGVKNFPSVSDRSLLLSNYESPTSENYLKDMKEWIEEVKIGEIKDVTIDNE